MVDSVSDAAAVAAPVVSGIVAVAAPTVASGTTAVAAPVVALVEVAEASVEVAEALEASEADPLVEVVLAEAGSSKQKTQLIKSR